MPKPTQDNADPASQSATARHIGSKVTPNPELAEACHELRQPLQSLCLLHAMLEKAVTDPNSKSLVARIGASISTMTAVVDGLSEAGQSTHGLGQRLPARAPDAGDTAIIAACDDASAARTFAPVVFVVDDDADVRAAIRYVLEDDGRTVEEFASCEAFLRHDRSERDGCLLVDAYLPGMNGIELLRRLQELGHTLPAMMITGNSDVPMAVEAMKAGAIDFIEKPISRDELITCIDRAMQQSRDINARLAWRRDAARHIDGLTERQRQIMNLVLAGHPSKNIAADLGISQRTVENHRASIMKRTGARSLPALARLALTATSTIGDASPDGAA